MSNNIKECIIFGVDLKYETSFFEELFTLTIFFDLRILPAECVLVYIINMYKVNRIYYVYVNTQRNSLYAADSDQASY